MALADVSYLRHERYLMVYLFYRAFIPMGQLSLAGLFVAFRQVSILNDRGVEDARVTNLPSVSKVRPRLPPQYLEDDSVEKGCLSESLAGGSEGESGGEPAAYFTLSISPSVSFLTSMVVAPSE